MISLFDAAGVAVIFFLPLFFVVAIVGLLFVDGVVAGFCRGIVFSCVVAMRPSAPTPKRLHVTIHLPRLVAGPR